MAKSKETKEQALAHAAFECGNEALKQNDLDKAVWDFFRASRIDHGNKIYHQAFADALLKRGLKPLDENDEYRAEDLYQKALKVSELTRLDMKLEATLLGHLDAAYDLRREFVVSVWTTPEAEALTELLFKAEHPVMLCDIARNYEIGMSGYPKDRKKAMELLEKAAALGYEQAAQTIENIIRNDKEEIERQKKEEEYSRRHPPLTGEAKKKAEEELVLLLQNLVRKATLLNFEKPEAQSEPPAPEKQILTSHAGGYPYFEEGGKWPTGQYSGKPIDFIFQVFQDDNYSMALPFGIKLLQVFFDREKQKEYIKIYFNLQKEKIAVIKNPLKKGLKYQVINFETFDMLPLTDYIDTAVPKVMAAANKIHPGKIWSVLDRVIEELGIKQPSLDSYLGGYPADMSNSPMIKKPYNLCLPLFQLYLDDGVLGWKNWYDAMLYADYYYGIKEADSMFIVNYD